MKNEDWKKWKNNKKMKKSKKEYFWWIFIGPTPCWRKQNLIGWAVHVASATRGIQEPMKEQLDYTSSNLPGANYIRFSLTDSHGNHLRELVLNCTFDLFISLINSIDIV